LIRLVVADTSPIFYLLSIGHIDLLRRLFGKVFVPDAVHRELCHPMAPPVVGDWVAELPAWAEVTQVEPIADPTLESVGAGERAAITLALSLHADLVLIDERKGTPVALGKGSALLGRLASSVSPRATGSSTSLKLSLDSSSRIFATAKK
jgi:predicted nucleic acid-binding protein